MLLLLEHLLLDTKILGKKFVEWIISKKIYQLRAISIILDGVTYFTSILLKILLKKFILKWYTHIFSNNVSKYQFVV